jgi:hypothetical protein
LLFKGSTRSIAAAFNSRMAGQAAPTERIRNATVGVASFHTL